MINDVVGVQALATLVQSSEAGDIVDGYSRLAPPRDSKHSRQTKREHWTQALSHSMDHR